MTLSIGRNKHLSVLLVFSILFSMFFFAATPPAEAGLFRALAKIGRAVAVTATAITGGVVGAVVGCVGGGPVGALVGFTAGTILAGTAMAAISSNTGTSAVAGAAVGAVHGMLGGPLGIIGGALVGGIVGAAIGHVAENEDYGCGMDKKGGKEDSGFINVPDQAEKNGVIEPAPEERAEAPEALPADLPEADSTIEDPVLPEIPEQIVPEAGSTTYSDASDGNSEESIDSLDISNPQEMGVEESVQFLVKRSEDLDVQRQAVLSNEASSVQYESMIDEREEVAKALAEKIIKEIEENNGRPGENYSQFKAKMESIPAGNRSAVKDVIEILRENAIHNRINSLNSASYQNLADELERM